VNATSFGATYAVESWLGLFYVAARDRYWRLRWPKHCWLRLRAHWWEYNHGEYPRGDYFCRRCNAIGYDGGIS
jgi:hypothetical protein